MSPSPRSTSHAAGGRKRTRLNSVADDKDQRNHGKRVVNKTANLAYDQNPNHLFDMTACVCAFSGPRLSTAFREYYTFMLTAVGGCQDVTLIMDFLGSYLFPHGERTIDEWVATGISLGGNLTWRLLQLGESTDVRRLGHSKRPSFPQSDPSRDRLT